MRINVNVNIIITIIILQFTATQNTNTTNNYAAQKSTKREYSEDEKLKAWG